MADKEFIPIIPNKRKQLVIKNCVICGNVRCSPWGKDRERQRYKCSKCGYKFIEGSSGDLKMRRATEILRKEAKQWKETCEVLVDPELRKSITKSMKEFAEGKGIPLDKL